MVSIYKRKNKDGTSVWRAIIRIKGYPTICNHFDRKQEADDWAVPIDYKVIRKDLYFSDLKTGKIAKKASFTKNEHFSELVSQAIVNRVKFDYVLADN